jgi:hypothetical protein
VYSRVLLFGDRLHIDVLKFITVALKIIGQLWSGTAGRLSDAPPLAHDLVHTFLRFSKLFSEKFVREKNVLNLLISKDPTLRNMTSGSLHVFRTRRT